MAEQFFDSEINKNPEASAFIPGSGIERITNWIKANSLKIINEGTSAIFFLAVLLTFIYHIYKKYKKEHQNNSPIANDHAPYEVVKLEHKKFITKGDAQETLKSLANMRRITASIMAAVACLNIAINNPAHEQDLKDAENHLRSEVLKITSAMEAVTSNVETLVVIPVPE